MDRVVEDREVVMVRRRHGGDVALVAADELEGLLETTHLLRSPRNAARLLAALQRAKAETLPARPLEGLEAWLEGWAPSEKGSAIQSFWMACSTRSQLTAAPPGACWS